MRVVIIGQRSFGKAVLEAFLSRGDDVAGVFVAPEKKGAKPDVLKRVAGEKCIPLFQFANLRSDEALVALNCLKADIAVMAYVLQFVPQEFATLPRWGTIQFHPSLLPKYRGPSAVNWAIVCGEQETGVTVFRPTDGMDEGPVIVQKSVPIHEDDTAGSLYYERLFPLGIQALLEAADKIVGGTARLQPQDSAAAHYEGWLRSDEARINWHSHVRLIYNLIRGCHPKPGAWTLFQGKKITILKAEKTVHHAFDEVMGKTGTVAALDDKRLTVGVQGGEIHVFSVQLETGQKMNAAQWAKENGVNVGMTLGD